MVQKIFILSTLPLFTIAALILNWDSNPFRFDGEYAVIKIGLWILFIAFSSYSGYCTLKEDIFQTIKEVIRFHFGRQICFDLYLGALLIFFIIFLNEPTILGFFAWCIPMLFFVNLLSILYFAIHFDELVIKLTALI